jgi:DNA-binding transcriptional LysR family regulator
MIMSDFSNAELRRIDLTLLLVFLGLMRHRKATDVASELGLTQSGVSQALKRLRDIFSDDLFLRRPHGMEPTATAVALEAPIALAVDALRGAIGTARHFDPATAEGIIRIAAADSQQMVVIPQLAQRLRKTAPGLRLSLLPIARAAALDALIEGRVELALGFVWDIPETVRSAVLYDEDYRVVGIAETLPDAPNVSMENYLAADHILVSLQGGLRGIVDEELKSLGKTRTVILAVSAFLPALAAAAVTGALVTLPSRIADTFAGNFGLVVAEPPLPIRPFSVSILWHRRSDSDPRIVWLRNQIMKL